MLILVLGKGKTGSLVAEVARERGHGVRTLDIDENPHAVALTPPNLAGVDVVIDAVGGPLTGQAVGGLARGGRLVVMGYAAGTQTDLRLTDLVWRRAVVSGFSLFAATPEQQAEAYATILPLIASGEIAPAHERAFSLEQAPEALRHLIEDRPYGKVTLLTDPHRHARSRAQMN